MVFSVKCSNGSLSTRSSWSSGMYDRNIFPEAVACNGVCRPVQSTLRADAREMLWWMTTASSPSRTAMVTVSLVRSLSRSQTGLAHRRMSKSALTALASRTSPKPSLYFSVAASCSTNPRYLKVVSSRYAVDLWMSSSLETSVTPAHPRCERNSITEMARSTDCTEGLLRTTAHIGGDPTLPPVSWLDPPGASRLRAVGELVTCRGGVLLREGSPRLPECSYVCHLCEGARTTVRPLCRLPVAEVTARPLAGGRPYRTSQPVEAKEVDIVTGKPLLGQVGHDLSDDAGEFEAVTRAG